MSASKSSSSGASRRRASKSSGAAASRRKSAGGNNRGDAKREAAGRRATVTDNLGNLAEQLANYFINPLGLVLLTRERIQDTMDEAAERGRLTRTDANELTAELVRRGKLQTEELLEAAARRTKIAGSVDRIVRTADRARRTVGVGPSFPILGYDELTATQVHARLEGLTPTELRKVRDYERRHANRKSVLDAVERALD